MQFLPPGFNLPLAWTVDFSFSLLIKFYQEIEDIEISPEDRSMLRELRDKRLVLLCNHPSIVEPAIAYYVGQKMGSRFQFMTSREIFDDLNGIMGKLIQGLGAFSASSGEEARQTSRSILGVPGAKLALFPEGEPHTGENDALWPLQADLLEFTLAGLDEARKTEPGADIAILPCFVKYAYTGTDPRIKSDLHVALKKLERIYSLEAGNKNILRRFIALARAYLSVAEKEYGLDHPDRKDFDYRSEKLRHAILDKVASKLQVPGYDDRADDTSKLRVHRRWLEQADLGRETGIPNLTKRKIDWARQECYRVHDFLVMRPERLISRPTAERFYEWLTRFELRTQNKSEYRTRKAIVNFASAFSLSEYCEEYKKDPAKGVASLSKRVRLDLERQLEMSIELSMPIVRPYDIGDDEI